MLAKKIAVFTVLAIIISGCAACNVDNPLVRTGGGAAAGASVAAITGGDPLAGAAVGGGAGLISCLFKKCDK